MKKNPRRRVDVNVEELDRVIDETEKGPLSDSAMALTAGIQHGFVGEAR